MSYLNRDICKIIYPFCNQKNTNKEKAYQSEAEVCDIIASEIQHNKNTYKNTKK